MDREQAEKIVNWLVGAALDLDEARAAAETLQDQDKDAASLYEVVERLNDELVETIFERFPSLVPFEEFPAISSSLGWDQVRLPPSVSETQIDEIIMSFIVPQGRKMARIVGEARNRSDELGLGINYETFAARIRALVDAGRLEGQGDLRRWRHSEVRLGS